MLFPNLFQGGMHEDIRGKVCFVNSFDMAAVKRFYQIQQNDTSVIRAWQGHQAESKWFYCIQGQLVINYLQPLEWSEKQEVIHKVILSEQTPQVLHIPPKYVTGIKAVEVNSILMIYSDFNLEASKLDDFRFDINRWQFKI